MIEAAALVVVAVFVCFSFYLKPVRWDSGEDKKGRAVHAASLSVVINEIMWAGSTVSMSDEWIELHNQGASDIDMIGWTLEKAAGSGSAEITLPSGAIIPAGGYFIISNFSKDHASSAFKVEVDFETSSVALLNEKNGNILLKNFNGEVIDQALGLSWPAGESSKGTKKSMERGVNFEDGLLTTSWHTSTISADDKNFGTPRAANSLPIINTAPIPIITGSTSGLIGATLFWSAADSTDADNDELTFSWTFGDGGKASGESVSHAYSAPGSYNVTLTVADGTSEVEAARMVNTAAPVYSNAIVINELLPNPTGSDTTAEFIEIRNTGEDSIDLSGWQLDDAEGGSASYAIPAPTIMGGGSIKSFLRSETKLALNNSGDSVRLLDPNGAIKSFYTYTSSVAEGQSYNRTSEGSYLLSTTLTPGAANTITSPVADDAEDEDSSLPAATAKAETNKAPSKAGKVAGTMAKTAMLKDIREEDEGTTITTEGIISVPPGILSEKEIYLAGSGIQVYFHEASWPALKLGDRVKITGELGSNRGESRLKVSAATSITTVSVGPPPAPHAVPTGEISEDTEGWLVTVQGQVVDTSGDTFYVDDGSGDVKIYIRSATKIDKPKMKTGEVVTITGVVSETSSGYRILPRFQEDIRLGRVAGLTSFPATGKSVQMIIIGFFPLSAALISSAIMHREPLSSLF